MENRGPQDGRSPPGSRVSFQPLTPHNPSRGGALRRGRGTKRSTSTPSSGKKAASAEATMLNLDPNANANANTNAVNTRTSTGSEPHKHIRRDSVHSLRRSLRATMMSPSVHDKENLHSTHATAMPPKTPKSLLTTELDGFQDVDESLLISPTDRTHLRDTSPHRRGSLPRLSTALQGRVSNLSGSGNQQQPEPKLTSKDLATTLQPKAMPVADKHPQCATGGERANGTQAIPSSGSSMGPISAEQKSNLPPLARRHHANAAANNPLDTPEFAGDILYTPYKTRGNGVQMDLSAMFTTVTLPTTKAVSPYLDVHSDLWNESEEAPVASLDKAQVGLWLDFGDERENVVGATRTLPFVLEGSTTHDCVVEVERLPSQKGFQLLLEDGDSFGSPTASDTPKICVARGDALTLVVSWTPVETGGLREALLLKLPRGRLRVAVHGRARHPSLDSQLDVTSLKRRPGRETMPAVPKSLLDEAASPGLIIPQDCSSQFGSNPTPARPLAKDGTTTKVSSSPDTGEAASFRHHHETISGNWAEKQCEAFANWLNYLFQPTEERDHEASHGMKQNGGSTKLMMDRTALRTLLVHRRMALVRSRALDLLGSHKVQATLHALDLEVSRKRLALREDRDMYADLTLRGQVTSLLMSYSTPWLRLGLETLFGEAIQPETPNQYSPQKLNCLGTRRSKREEIPLSRMKLTLKRFIIHRVLSDPNTLQKYTKGRCKVPSGNFERKFRAETRILTLRRLLTLVIFLDRAKEANIIDKEPRLFMKGSKVKSTRDVLIALCRDFLSSEGDIVKHLSRIGVKVTYRQESVDEIDFTITNLATDLRDGVRLARMTEIVTKQNVKTVLKELRLPAVSRLQKLHNVRSVLEILHRAGVTGVHDVAAHHIVDGHREMVLKLMWLIVSRCGLGLVLKRKVLEAEIEAIKQANSSCRHKWELAINAESFACAERTDEGLQFCKDDDVYKSLLLQWANAICARYGASISDLTNSFADGTVLCLLINFYHPSLLPLDQILSTTRNLPINAPEGIKARALANEKENFQLANARMNDLGGVPRMLPIADTESIPEEKSMLLCLAYLSSRLIESSREIKASVAIQSCFRRHKRTREFERKIRASRVIWGHWSLNKKRYFEAQSLAFQGAVRVIEKFVKSYQHRLPMIRRQRLASQAWKDAVIMIQSQIRRFQAKKKVFPILLRLRGAIKMQSQWRGFCGRKRHGLSVLQRSSALIIQRTWRYRTQRWANKERLESASCIQSLNTNRTRNETASVTKIQSIWRGFWTQLQFQIDLMDTIAVQSIVRRWLASRAAQKRVQAVSVLQSFWRTLASRRHLLSMAAELARQYRMTAAALIIQTFARQVSARRCARNLKHRHAAAVKIQSRWRHCAASLTYFTKFASSTLIQQAVRGWLARHALKRLQFRAQQDRRRAAVMREAASIIQSNLRGRLTRIAFCRKCKSATAIQKIWRGFSAFVRFQLVVQGIISTQRQSRRYLAIKCLCQRKQAIILLQSNIRMRLAISRVSQLQVRILVESTLRASCATSLQAAFRGYLMRRKHCVLLHSAITIQRSVRGFLSQLTYHISLIDIITVQSIVRQWLARYRYTRLLSAIVQLQRVTRLKCVQAVNRQERAFSRRQCAVVLIQKTWRCYDVHVDYMLLILSVIAIQSSVRRFRCETQFRRDLRSISVVQSAARGWLKNRKQTTSANAIQNRMRSYSAWRNFQRKRAAALVIQAAARGFVARIDLDLSQFAATEIQRVWRGYLATTDFVILLIASVRIQSAARMLLSKQVAFQLRDLRVLEKVEVMFAERQASRIQSAFRRYARRRRVEQVVSSVQCVGRGFMSRSKLQRQKIAAVAVQSVARGYIVRRGRPRQAATISRRLHRASLHARRDPSMYLGARTAVALVVLEGSMSLSEIMAAVTTLEMTTRLSLQCCIAFTECTATEVLFALIRTCNRSLPHIELLSHVLSTFRNLVKHEMLLPRVASANAAEVFMDLVQMFRDKENVFCSAVLLLQRVVSSSRSLQLRFASTENLKRLKGVYSLCVRKISVSTVYRSPSGRLTRQSEVPSDWKRGVRTLQKVISLLES